MIDTLIFLLVCIPFIVTTVWYAIEIHEINLHKREMEELWDLYAKESMLPGNPILEKKPKAYMKRDASIPYRD